MWGLQNNFSGERVVGDAGGCGRLMNPGGGQGKGCEERKRKRG